MVALLSLAFQLTCHCNSGYKAIVVTVDAPVAGNRERDDRVKINDEIAGDGGFRNAVVKSQSLAEMGFSYVDATLQWTDLDWIRQVTKLPVIVKGVQSYEDALLCVKHRAHIYLSNHGGRQLEGAPSAIETLLEIRKYAPEVLKSSSQILADGGIKRGTDVLKLLALGATSVGVGRPFMYSLAFDNGPERVIEIMSKEIRTNMRLLGATSINEMCEEMVNTRRLDDTIYVAASPKSKL
jgi:L-lactate dehydrogenase (cytochrome)